ncbi:Spiroplasmavirus-related protein [Spiroplasma kunkelii CR2-3x]|uniref:Spiroplasmavirus-related protein n=1 Tax=Spiroplasma kunkelii CR2-3x TaxID=273035 RepID=A0A0K2JGY7_SPIKU|nr:DUF3688 family protein [Spiroplasma kunkelii]ALA97687.1 Spiroplasmavirus-related protein [Spiroplasma kunkelii CR2-3x]
MKKWINILETIGLTATITTTLISCEKSEKPNNNKEENKSITPKPQQPPEGSNWKLINNNNLVNEIQNINNKWYSVIFNFESYKIVKFCNSDYETDVDFNNLRLMKGNDGNLYLYEKWKSPLPIADIKFLVYRWDGKGEPQLPTINKNTGKIIDWKEQKGTK